MSLPRIPAEKLFAHDLGNRSHHLNPADSNSGNWILPAIIGLAVLVVGLVIITQQQNHAMLKAIGERVGRIEGEKEM